MDVNRRLDELELRSAYQERMIEELNDVMIQQQTRLAQLEQALNKLRSQLAEPQIRRPQDETPPPHY